LYDPTSSVPLVIALLASLLSGCGAALPVLQPAQVLPSGHVEAAAGLSGQLGVGDVDERIAAGRDLGAAGTAADRQEELLTASFLEAGVAPGLAPWVAAAVGLGSGNEAGLQYTGRSLRIGLRHAWTWDALALSVGAGGASVITRRNQAEVADTSSDGLTSSGVDWYARGFAADLPIVFGWQAPGRILGAWVGARMGFEALDGGLPFVQGASVADAPAQAHQWYGGGLIGASVGVAPLWVRLELSANYHDVRGEAVLDWSDVEPETLEIRTTAFTISPAAALIVEF
jgi:hypothetical protein